MWRTWLALLVFLVAHSGAWADWPQVRGNAARSGWTADALPAKFAPVWSYRPTHGPQPAWPREDRVIDDRAFHVTSADGSVFFGSSVEGTVTALDAATGDVRWTFYTDGPVRFAPAIWRDRVFAVSDDGHLYCLGADDGRLLQKWRGGPAGDLVLGNDRIISRRPARGAPVIVDDTIYYAAGIWQSEGIFLYAIDAESGEIRWVNDSSGSIYMPQPHGGANAESGVTAQGYLLASGEQLFVPTGRAVPAAFNRADGEFQYYHLQKNGKQGGSEAMLAGGELFNLGHNYSGTVFDAKTGDGLSRLKAGAYAAVPEGVLYADGKSLTLLKRTEKKSADRKGDPVTVVEYKADWTIQDVPGGVSLIVAGSTAISGGAGQLAAVDLGKQERVWSTKIEGTAYGLAAAGGRLFVSTDDGAIHCFAATGGPHREIRQPVDEKSPFGDQPQVAAQAAKIVEQSKITAGYCLDLGCGDGALAYELAQRTNLHIVAVDPDPKNVEAARKNLSAAGLHGARVSVLQADLADTQLPKFVFNLIVSHRSLAHGAEAVDADEVTRLQRPYGGVVCLGPAESLQVATRGALETAGTWTHQYTDPANTGCTADEVKGPLRVLWFNDINLELPQRHGRGPAPLFGDGRLFVMGMDALMAVDAYNGRVLWQFAVPGALHAYDADHLMGTAGTGSNFCLAGDSVYVRQGGVCHQLDAATGETKHKFAAPKHADGKPAVWGYLASQDGILFGTAANEEHVVKHSWRPADMSSMFTESKFLFAYDVETKELLWRYDAEESIRHNAIAIGDGRVFVIDRALAVGDLLDPSAAARRGEKDEKPGHPTGTLLALDMRTGKEKWRSKDDIFGTLLAYSEPHDMLLMAYQSTRFKLPSEIGGRLAVFKADEGYRVWDRKANYVTRPLINGRTIYAQGGAWDLLRGHDEPFDFSRSYGCGQLAGSKHLLLYRSATFGYFDFTREAKTENYGGMRPGCWINALPAGGLVLLPDASAGCSCSYQSRAWLALQGSE
jgi:outer membrane protein assembly factor BamB